MARPGPTAEDLAVLAPALMLDDCQAPRGRGPARAVRLAASLAAAGVLAATGTGCGEETTLGPDRDSGSSSSALLGNSPGPDVTAADFALRDHEGRLVRLSDQRGRAVLVSFLYTSCPDVCPLIAESLNQALRELGPERARVRVLAVSVDPTHDTRAAARRFLARHHALPEFRYLVGSRRQLAPVWQAYNVLVTPRNLDTLDHAAHVFLVDPTGRVRAVYEPTVRARTVEHDLRAALGAG
jgi:protein SCO1/2